MSTPFYRLLLDPEAGEGGAAAESPPAKAPEPPAAPPAKAPEPAPRPKPKAAEPEPEADDLGTSAAALFIQKNGGAVSAVERLLGEAADHRSKNRDLKAKLPPEGSVVMDADSAAALAAFEALGHDPASLKQALYEGDQFRAEAEGFRKGKVYAEAAALASFNPEVFADLAATKGLDVEVRDDKDKQGKPVKVAVVKGDGDSATPLADYAKANLAGYLPALLKAGDAPAKVAGGTPPGAAGSPKPPVGAGAGRSTVRRRAF